MFKFPFFFTKRSEVHIDFFTAYEFMHEYIKPDYAYKFIPEWWKKTPKTESLGNNSGPSIKMCRGFMELYKNSIMLPSCRTIYVNIPPYEYRDTAKLDFEYAWLGDTRAVDCHPPIQYYRYVNSEYKHLKVLYPWMGRCKKDVNFLMHDPMWNRSELSDRYILPGVIDLKYQTEMHCNMFVKCQPEPSQLKITLGDPLCFLTPLTDKKVVMHYHLEDERSLTYKVIDGGKTLPESAQAKDLNLYKIKKKIIQDAEKRNSLSKCPFKGD